MLAANMHQRQTKEKTPFVTYDAASEVNAKLIYLK